MTELMGGEANQYLTFKLDDEVFAVCIDKVREVLDYTTVTGGYQNVMSRKSQ